MRDIAELKADIVAVAGDPPTTNKPGHIPRMLLEATWVAEAVVKEALSFKEGNYYLEQTLRPPWHRGFDKALTEYTAIVHEDRDNGA